MRPPRAPAGRPARRRQSAAAALLLASLAGPARAGDAPAWAAVPAGLLPQRWPVAAAAADDGWRWQLEAADASASDATAVRGFDGDWARYHPRSGRNAAVAQARLELSASRASWELAATLRSDLLVTGSRDAFDLVQADKQRLPLADGRPLALRAREQGVVWAGLRAARSWAWWPAAEADAAGLQFTAALTTLSVRRVQTADAVGTARHDGSAGNSFEVSTLRQDSARQFDGWGTAHATGSGLSGDLGLLWQPSRAGFVGVSVVDAVSRVRVHGVATEQMQLSSATIGTDARGYLDYKPLLTGRNSASDLRLRLLPKWTLVAGGRADALGPAWQRPAGSLGADAQAGLRWQRIDGLDLPALWVSAALMPGLALQLDADTRFRSLGVGLQHRWAGLQLRSAAAEVGHSRALAWQLTVGHRW